MCTTSQKFEPTFFLFRLTTRLQLYDKDMWTSVAKKTLNVMLNTFPIKDDYIDHLKYKTSLSHFSCLERYVFIQFFDALTDNFQ